MKSVSEKSKPPSKLHSCLIAFSIFLLIFSLLSLLELNDTYLIPKSVLQLVILDNSSTNIKPNVHKSAVFKTETSEMGKVGIQIQEKMGSQASNPKRVINEPKRIHTESCGEKQAILRVYMYDLPPEFHFGLLGWKGNGSQTWPGVDGRSKLPSHPGGLNLQHSAEYWLTLDLLASNAANVIRPCTAIRVKNSNEADVIFVPFFSSLSYNRHSKVEGKQKISVDRFLQENLVEFLKSQNEWKRFGGRDHVIVAHHPNSLLFARKKLASAMFVLADFGRYPIEIANIEKDVIAPYKHMVRAIAVGDSPSFDERLTLIYFQGAIYRKDGGAIRQELYYLLKDEKDVHFIFGSVQSDSIRQAGRGMASSKFCLNIAGDTPSSNRLFDSIATNCVPVIISNEIELPFEDILDYSEFSIFVHSSDAVKRGYLLNLLRGIKREKWIGMWERLKEICRHFEYEYPSRSGDAVDMIWQAVKRRKTGTWMNVYRKKRYGRLRFL